MEQFSLDKWLKDKSRKVVTRDGKEVDIYYSPTSRIPLIGRTSDNEIHQYTETGFQNERMNQAKNDLFFADDEVLKLPFIKELEEYLKNTPKEQVEKDWKEIQDWYNQHFANKSNEEDELTEFEKALVNFLEIWGGCEVQQGDYDGIKLNANTLLDIACKQIYEEFKEFSKLQNL